MLRRTPVTQAAVQRLNSRGWREGASLEANLEIMTMITVMSVKMTIMIIISIINSKRVE